MRGCACCRGCGGCGVARHWRRRSREGDGRAYPSWNIERHAFGEVYEDLSFVVYELGKGADWNAMAKAYRRRVLAREGATRRIETLKERAKARPHLLKMANAIALRRRHACKPYVFKDPKHDVDFTPETEKKPLGFSCGNP